MTATTKRRLLKRIQWRIEYAAFLCLERLAALLSMESLWRIGASLSKLAYLLRSRRMIVHRNLRTVLNPGTSEEEITSLAREVFRHTAANFLTALKGSQLSAHLVHASITPRGVDVLENAIGKKKGVILVCPHMGNFELLTQALGTLSPELKVAAVYRPLSNIYLDPLIRKRRSHRKMQMFSKFTSYKAPINFVREGGILGILADQRAGGSGTIVPFFDRLMSMSPLPAFVHKHTGAPVVGISMRTISPGKWEVMFHEPDLEKNEAVSTAHIANLLEKAIRQSFADVFWMQDLWRLNQQRPLHIDGKKGPIRLGRSRETPLHPFAVLVRIPDNASAIRPTLPALEAIRASRPDLTLHVLARERVRRDALLKRIPHYFHSIEKPDLPPDLELALILTDVEPEAREVGHIYDGPIYSLPETLQSGGNWHQVTTSEHLSPDLRWMDLAEKVGMHDPPLQLRYL